MTKESSVQLRRPDASHQLAVVQTVGNSSAAAFAAAPPDTEIETFQLASLDQTRLLIVDDDEQICELLSRVLVRAGYRVQTAANAEDAMDLLGRQAFDLVVCDMQMGRMSGLDLTVRAARLYPEVPVVLMTAQRDTELMRTALREGAVDFIPKPFDFDTIPIIIERSLERLALNQKQAEEHRRSRIFSNLQALAAAIDAKEPYTAQHSRRVAQLSRATAAAMALPAVDLQLVEWAALVHDVGKIATPDRILMKSGKLTEEEWRIVRLHPIKGAQIVEQVPDLHCVGALVRSHHERIDGAGYPDGLCGEQIPLLARIIAVTDAFEVMTSNRVYRAPIGEREALRRLGVNAESQFDRAVVAAFVGLSSEARR
jgi:putative two-component system response regulator